MSTKVSTRDKILNATLELVGQKGINSVNVTAIAKICNIQKSLVVYHFKSIKDILQEIFLMAGKQGQTYTKKAFKDADTLEEEISAIIIGAFSWLKNEPLLGDFFILMYHQASKIDPLFEIHQNILNTGLERIKLSLYKSMEMKSHKDVDALALGIHSLIVGAIIRYISIKKVMPLKEVLSSLQMTLEQILNRKMPNLAESKMLL